MRRSAKRVFLLLLLGVLVGCSPRSTPLPTNLPAVMTVSAATAPPTEASPAPAPVSTPIQPPPTVPPISARFAPYRATEVSVKLSVSHKPIAPDLSNAVSAFLLSPQQRERLAQNGFVVSPSEEKEFYVLYEAYYLERMAYLSFDLQDADHAIVTTRETWWGERYQESTVSGDLGVLIATQPSYTVGMIYHLERAGDRWLVSQQQTQGDVPRWEEGKP